MAQARFPLASAPESRLAVMALLLVRRALMLR